jgi:hypothetical protein
MDWLVNESRDIDSVAEASIATSVQRMKGAVRGDDSVALALRLNDVLVHDTKKWFGGADIRLDAVVVNGAPADGEKFYQPSTFRFSDVRDGERLPIEAPGLVFFYGKPKYFLDVSIMVSRDRKDSEDLRDLIVKRLGSTEWKAASATLLGLAIAAPQAAVVAAAIGAAATVGNFAAEILRDVTGTTIGLYRTSWLQERDRFGIGRHPKTGSYRQKDFEFWYEIVAERKRKPAG